MLLTEAYSRCLARVRNVAESQPWAKEAECSPVLSQDERNVLKSELAKSRIQVVSFKEELNQCPHTGLSRWPETPPHSTNR